MSAVEFDLIDLGAAGVGWIRKVLDEDHRGTALSKLLLETCCLERGRVFTKLPKGTSMETALLFEEGGILPLPPGAETYVRNPEGTCARITEVPTMDYWLEEVAGAFLAAGPNRLCLFADALSSRRDEWIDKKKGEELPFAFHKDEVYYLVTKEGTRKLPVAIRGSSGAYPSLVASMSVVARPKLYAHPPIELGLEDFEALVQGTRKLAIGAYDGEGYVIWEAA